MRKHLHSPSGSFQVDAGMMVVGWGDKTSSNTDAGQAEGELGNVCSLNRYVSCFSIKFQKRRPAGCFCYLAGFM